jgi:pimeloyl-ACP methyl ester carboxylesterase
MGALEETIEIAGLRISYRQLGDGPPLFLLHGFVGDGLGTWRRQIEELSDSFTVVAWDAPGSGASSDPPESFRMTDYADCLARFIDALDLGRAHVAGLSFGGALALELYRRHPGIPTTLVLAGAYAGWTGSLAPEVVEQRLQQCLQASALPPDQFAPAMMPTMFSESAPPEGVDEFARSVSEFHPAGFRAMARALAEADLRDVLPRIAVPTLLLYGGKDVRAPLSIAYDLHAAIPASKLVVLPVGHISSVEGAERFNAEVRSFLITAKR